MAITKTTAYAGGVLETFITLAVTGNDTVDNGIINIKSGIQHEYTLPRLGLVDVIQDRVATPTFGTGSKGDFVISERKLAPLDFMVYSEFNPRDLEDFWEFAQPTNNLVFRTLDPQVQVAMVTEIMKEVNRYMGVAIWHGLKTVSGTLGTNPAGNIALGSGSYDKFDGLMSRILEDELAAVAGDIPIRTGSALLTTGALVLTALLDIFAGIPKAIRGSSDLKILCDWDTFDLYDQYLIELGNKNADQTGGNATRFRGVTMVPMNGFPANTIVATRCSASRGANMWMGVDYVNDDNVITMDKLQNNSEEYFFKMLMKADTKVVNPSELVFHTAYPALT